MEKNRIALQKLLKKNKINVEEIKCIVSSYELDINQVDGSGMNVLHLFIHSGNLQLVNFLFTLTNENANVTPDLNIKTAFSCPNGIHTPLTLALVASNDMDDMYAIVKTLIFVDP